MKPGQLIDVTASRDSVDTFETYSNGCFLFGTSLLWPLINLYIIDAKVVGNSSSLRIEYAYLLLTSVSHISWMGENKDRESIVGERNIMGSSTSTITDWFALHTEDEGYELKISYSKLSVFIPVASKYGQDWWTPWDTGKFKMNLDTKMLERFWNLELLPSRIYKEGSLDVESRTKLEFSKSTEEQVRWIKDHWSET